MSAAEAPESFISGIVLAAGTAKRMGSPKQLLRLGDRSILQRVIDAALDSHLDEVIVVLGAHAEEVRSAISMAERRDLRFVLNADFANGISASLKCGLRACDSHASAAAILLGDQPGIGAELIDHVLGAYAVAGAPVVRPVFVADTGVETPGHPVILARNVWEEVEALEGDEGARVLCARAPARVHELRIEREAPTDIDTVEDYRRAVEHAAIR